MLLVLALLLAGVILEIENNSVNSKQSKILRLPKA